MSMKHKCEVIKANLLEAKRQGLVSDAVYKGQVEELGRLVRDELLDFSQVIEFFRDVFDQPYLSREFMMYLSVIKNYYSFEAFAVEDIFDQNNLISYLKNRYSTEALERFIDICGGEAEYEADFNSVCESVYSGRSVYAVVPLSNTTDGLHVSLYKLLLKYDLKIVAATSIIMADGVTESKFVLATKSDTVLNNATNALISFTSEVDSFLPKLLEITTSVGIKVKLINTLPLEYTDDRYEIIIDFDLSSFDVDVFRAFIKFALPDCNIIGMYYTVK